jgi:hypothetical protein
MWLVWVDLDFWESGNLGLMKTTLEIPDELYRAVKAKAALEGKPVTQLVVESLRLAMAGKTGPLRKVEFPIIKSKPGGKTITLDQLKRAQEAMDEEEVSRFVQPVRR